MRNFASIFLPILILSACGSYSADKPVDRNILTSDVEKDGETVSGRYDPAEFSTAQARKMASFNCKKSALASYGEVEDSGQRVFTATCRDGTVHGRYSGVDFKRSEDGTVEYSAIFSLNGVITTAQGIYPL